jgi:hypothetical protein
VANPFEGFTVHLDAGETVYQEGEVGTMMYVVQSGAVELYRQVNGQRISYGTLEKGDFFGEMSLLLERQARTTSAVVIEEAALVEIDATLFDKMIRGNIEIAVRMMRKLSLRLREYEVERGAEPQSVEKTTPPPAVEVQGTAEEPALAAADVTPSAGEPPAPPPAQASPPPPLPPAPEPEIPTPPPPPARPLQSALAAPRTLEQVRAEVPDSHAVLSGKDGVIHFPLVENESAIGRFDPVTGMRPEVDVSAIDINRSVSRHHARIVRSAEGYTLTEEVGALNGTFIDGTRLVTGEPTPIQDGNEIGLGVVRLQFHIFSS